MAAGRIVGLAGYLKAATVIKDVMKKGRKKRARWGEPRATCALPQSL